MENVMEMEMEMENVKSERIKPKRCENVFSVIGQMLSLPRINQSNHPPDADSIPDLLNSESESDVTPGFLYQDLIESESEFREFCHQESIRNAVDWIKTLEDDDNQNESSWDNFYDDPSIEEQPTVIRNNYPIIPECFQEEKEEKPAEVIAIPNLPFEIWIVILGYLNLKYLLEIRKVSKLFSKAVRHSLLGDNYQLESFHFYDYHTYHLADVLMEDQLFWESMKTQIGKFAMKFKIMKGAYESSINKVEKPYMRFIKTRCLPYHTFRRRFKILHPGTVEEVISEEYNNYKRTSWDEISTIQKLIIKTECKFRTYFSSLYVRRYQTSLPISLNQDKLIKIGRIQEKVVLSGDIHRIPGVPHRDGNFYLDDPEEEAGELMYWIDNNGVEIILG
jgi:hypothetical protein